MRRLGSRSISHVAPFYCQPSKVQSRQELYIHVEDEGRASNQQSSILKKTAKMQSVKDSIANVGASAKSGMEKTKATAQEKVDKMKAKDPMEKEMATERKDHKIHQAELQKKMAQNHNVMAGHGATTGTGYPSTGTAMNSTTGAHGHTGGTHQMSAVPGQPAGPVTEGVAGAHPIGTNTGTGRTTGDNPYVSGPPGSGYSTGGSYQ